MRTNIVLDDSLVKAAFRLSTARTKRDLIATALREYVRNHSRKDLREIRGKISFHDGYDYKSMRRAKAL